MSTPKLRAYSVYRQDPPIAVGKDRTTGDTIYAANLVELAVVQASSTADAWKQAYKYCAAPVLEMINVH